MVLNLKIVTQGTDWGAYPLLYNPQAVFCESKEKKTLFLSKITTKQILYLAVLFHLCPFLTMPDIPRRRAFRPSLRKSVSASFGGPCLSLSSKGSGMNRTRKDLS